ncbi:hypothetical protein SORBI_3003G382350 [Sorghum bicolor]|uniref:Uncharacterized protein n=1 Tax=Sorghum bicolor TaxID=4558 RepID=A0A1W0W0V0_SORBI|nr:hypothetical protein SORBI_3003G382350 [Sorghum bicolor]
MIIPLSLSARAGCNLSCVSWAELASDDQSWLGFGCCTVWTPSPGLSRLQDDVFRRIGHGSLLCCEMTY